jgi:mono/diheme cytochrome c family protein
LTIDDHPWKLPDEVVGRGIFHSMREARRWMAGWCVALMVASTSVASAQSPEVLSFGKGKPVPSGDVVLGQNIYNAVCWACHDRDLAGYKGPPLTGASFYKTWQGRSADALVDLIHNTMPKDDPGLTERGARGLVAYIVTYANKPESLTGGK